MKRLMAFFLGLVVIVSLTSCIETIRDATWKTTKWEMGMANTFLGGKSSNENGVKSSNEKGMVSDNNAMNSDNKKKKFVVGDLCKIKKSCPVANVRSSSAITSPTIAKLRAGDSIKVMGQRSGWINIKIDEERNGWVSSSLVE